MKNTFPVDEPKLVLTKDFEQCRRSLSVLGIEYKQITEGYMTFPAKLFDSKVDFIIGLHSSWHAGVKCVDLIEIFRTDEYYKASHGLGASYAEVSEILRKRYGLPDQEGWGGISVFDADRLPYEKWLTEEHMVKHYIMDRFGLYECLNIEFYPD